jgi:hypothetical protein
MNQTYGAPLSKWQRAVLYALDDALRARKTRRIVVYNDAIAKNIGTSKRRVIDAIQALERKGYVKTFRRKAPHGGWDANEYLVMPANPRKKAQIEQVAVETGLEPMTVLSRVSAFMEADADDSHDLRYGPGAATDEWRSFVEACERAGLSLRRNFVWS